MDMLKHAVPDRQFDPQEEPEWTADDLADQSAFQAINEARDTFFGVLRDLITGDMVDRFNLDDVQIIVESVEVALSEAGLPVDENDITAAIDEAIEEETQDAGDNYDGP
jgi:hypothetical protein